MFTKKIYQWNAVDVVRSNGEVHRGLVVDKYESYLLVDFDAGPVAGSEAEVIPCQYACLSNEYTSRTLVSVRRTGDVVVLMKLSKDQPWKWYSGNVLIRFDNDAENSFALVKIRTERGFITECVRSDYIRRIAYSGNPLRKNDFVKEECSVPDGFVYGAQSIAPWRKRFPRTHPIGIVDNTLHFLQLRYDNDFDVSEMVTALRDGITKKVEMDTAEGNRGIKRPHECISNNDEAETSSVTEDFYISHLSLYILDVVFSFLDGRQQTRIRPVCTAWNFRIISPECSRQMILDLSLQREKSHQYILGSWIFHCITEWTKYVTIRSTRSRTEPAILWDENAVLILKKIMQFKKPLSTLILFNMQLEPKTILTESRTAISEDMQRVCSRLIFKDVTILYLFDTYQEYLTSHLALINSSEDDLRTNSSEDDLRIAHGVVNVDSQIDLLVCFEEAATDFADPKHHDALEWVSKAIVQAHGEHGHLGHMFRQSQIISVLRDWQKNDVRFGPNTEWKHVQLAQLYANLLTLRDITLAVLVCLARRWKLEGSPASDDRELNEYFNGHSDIESFFSYDRW